MKRFKLATALLVLLGLGGIAKAGYPWFNDAVAGTVVQVKSGHSGRILAARLVNTTAAAAYLQVFNATSANVTLGTTVPAFTFRLAANESFNGTNLNIDVGQGNGLSIAGTTTATGAVGAAISVLLVTE